MTLRYSASTALLCALAIGLAAAAPAPLAVDSARITIAGTSNVHAWTASTTAVTVTSVRVAPGVAGPDFWAAILAPGALEAFSIAIPAASLTSPKDGLDKNMHKALKVREHAEIEFRLLRLEPGAAPGALRATGLLRIAGVEQEIAFDLAAARNGATLAVTGEVPIVMTDFGIQPPKAMLGMLRTDPKVTVRFETVLAIPLT